MFNFTAEARTWPRNGSGTLLHSIAEARPQAREGEKGADAVRQDCGQCLKRLDFL